MYRSKKVESCIGCVSPSSDVLLSVLIMGYWIKAHTGWNVTLWISLEIFLEQCYANKVSFLLFTRKLPHVYMLPSDYPSVTLQMFLVFFWPENAVFPKCVSYW